MNKEVKYLKASFPISEDLHDRIVKMISDVRINPTGKEKRETVIQLVNELTAEGMDYFFKHSLQIIGVNFIARKAISTGINATKKTVRILSTRFIRKFDDEKLIATVNFIESFTLS